MRLSSLLFILESLWHNAYWNVLRNAPILR
jgi:hypothetical protein